MHPSHLKKEFIFKQRDELLKILLNFMISGKEKSEIVTDSIRISGLSACAVLVYPFHFQLQNFP